MLCAWPFVRAWAVPLTCGVPFDCVTAMLTTSLLVPSSIYVIDQPSKCVAAEPIPFARGKSQQRYFPGGFVRAEVKIVGFVGVGRRGTQMVCKGKMVTKELRELRVVNV